MATPAWGCCSRPGRDSNRPTSASADAPHMMEYQRRGRVGGSTTGAPGRAPGRSPLRERRPRGSGAGPTAQPGRIVAAPIPETPDAVPRVDGQVGGRRPAVKPGGEHASPRRPRPKAGPARPPPAPGFEPPARRPGRRPLPCRRGCSRPHLLRRAGRRQLRPKLPGIPADDEGPLPKLPVAIDRPHPAPGRRLLLPVLLRLETFHLQDYLHFPPVRAAPVAEKSLRSRSGLFRWLRSYPGPLQSQ